MYGVYNVGIISCLSIIHTIDVGTIQLNTVFP